MDGKVLTMFALGALLNKQKGKEVVRKVAQKQENKKQFIGYSCQCGDIEAVHTHHVVAPSILLNADIALGTLRTQEGMGEGHSE